MSSTPDLHHQSHASSSSSAAVRQKRLKAGTACTNCRRKKLRCSGTPLCVRCVTHKLDCVVDETLVQKSSSKSYPRQPRQPRRPRAPKSSADDHRSYYSSNTSSQQQHRQHHHHHRVSISSFEDLLESDELEFQSDRRMSVSSSTSLSDLSPSPSASPSYSYDHYQGSGNPLHVVSLSDSNVSPPHQKQRKHSTIPHPLDTYPYQQLYRPLSPSVSSRSSATSLDSSSHPHRKRSSHDQGSSSRTKQLRRQESNPDRAALSPPLTPQQDQPNASGSEAGAAGVSAATGVTNKETDLKNKKNLKSVVSTISLDGHGQHFHGSSSGFYVCQLSSRYRLGLYPMPMVHLNDSDLWSHSLQITSERELPPKAEIDMLLNLYFRYMYPFSPLFVRQNFMEKHRAGRPSLSHILLLNAMFCNACWFSDDPEIKLQSTKYFSRAKIILDETYHVSQLSTIQALLMMSHYQHAVGNYSGGWLYHGMGIRIAHDVGLHRQDVDMQIDPEEAEVRKRVWWSLYMADRLGAGISGRPMVINETDYNVQMPNEDWISECGADDKIEHPFEPEKIISCRLLWSVKLFMLMGQVLKSMHCIEAEINGAFLADISRTHLPQLHNSLTSWFLSLPNELMYTPYTMSPNANHPPSPPTALLHMFYYTCLTMLHRPYLRPVNSSSIDPNFLISSRNICTAAATNVCHIADSLMLHGQLQETCYFGMACLLAAGTVHVHNAITPTPSNRETTRAGLSKSVKAAHELVKTFPVAETFIAIALDVFASQPAASAAAELASAHPPGAFIDISTFVAPFIDLTQLQQTVAGAGLNSSTIGNIYEAARLAKQARDGPSPAPSIQLRHPYGNFSLPLPESTGKDQSTNKLSLLWQNQIATAVAVAAIAFGGTDPLLGDQSLEDPQQFVANPLDLPESLRLAPIDSITFGEPSLAAGTTGLGLGFDSDRLAWDPLYLGDHTNNSTSTGQNSNSTNSHGHSSFNSSLLHHGPTVLSSPSSQSQSGLDLTSSTNLLGDLDKSTMHAADDLLVDDHPLLAPPASTSSIPGSELEGPSVSTPRTNRLEDMMKDDVLIELSSTSERTAQAASSSTAQEMDIDSESSLSSPSMGSSSGDSPGSFTADPFDEPAGKVLTKPQEISTGVGSHGTTPSEQSPPVVDEFSAEIRVRHDVQQHQSFMASLTDVMEDAHPIPFFLDGEDDQAAHPQDANLRHHGPVQNEIDEKNQSDRRVASGPSSSSSSEERRAIEALSSGGLEGESMRVITAC
ncbi:hypothetical protein EMPS_07130 [Entomortierella parvispora]|uniref:Zn(2)-C6 fungal-type domain-containing protein n=1 Tax=Entomortierella parvispora TaxID=205924 RepID=A0A9P3HDR7_9FUNG|nr:hypothetical protein EMPS_07130 [Entomortierella parvispora]